MKIYLSSPVSYYQREWNTKISTILSNKGFKVLLPQDISPKGIKHTRFEKYVYDMCIDMIQESDLGLLLLPYGRDCAWEAGYYKGLNKPFFIFVSAMNEDAQGRLRDWMVKGAVTGIITDNKDSYNILKSDLILKHKQVYLIDNIDLLPNMLESLISQSKNPYTFMGVGVVVESESRFLIVEETSDSEYYYRKKGMLGFPTVTIKPKESPIDAARRALREETAIVYEGRMSFLSTQNIPNAVGLFYKLNARNISSISKNLKWFSKGELLKYSNILRPTYINLINL